MRRGFSGSSAAAPTGKDRQHRVEREGTIEFVLSIVDVQRHSCGLAVHNPFLKPSKPRWTSWSVPQTSSPNNSATTSHFRVNSPSVGSACKSHKEYSIECSVPPERHSPRHRKGRDVRSIGHSLPQIANEERFRYWLYCGFQFHLVSWLTIFWASYPSIPRNTRKEEQICRERAGETRTKTRRIRDPTKQPRPALAAKGAVVNRSTKDTILPIRPNQESGRYISRLVPL